MDQEHILAEIRALKSFLEETDYNDNKLIEGLVNTMKSATPETFTVVFMAWIDSVLAQYGELVANRQIWRDKINELEAMLMEKQT